MDGMIIPNIFGPDHTNHCVFELNVKKITFQITKCYSQFQHDKKFLSEDVKISSGIFTFFQVLAHTIPSGSSWFIYDFKPPITLKTFFSQIFAKFI